MVQTQHKTQKFVVVTTKHQVNIERFGLINDILCVELLFVASNETVTSVMVC